MVNPVDIKTQKPNSTRQKYFTFGNQSDSSSDSSSGSSVGSSVGSDFGWSSDENGEQQQTKTPTPPGAQIDEHFEAQKAQKPKRSLSISKLPTVGFKKETNEDFHVCKGESGENFGIARFPDLTGQEKEVVNKASVTFENRVLSLGDESLLKKSLTEGSPHIAFGVGVSAEGDRCTLALSDKAYTDPNALDVLVHVANVLRDEFPEMEFSHTNTLEQRYQEDLANEFFNLGCLVLANKTNTVDDEVRSAWNVWMINQLNSLTSPNNNNELSADYKNLEAYCKKHTEGKKEDFFEKVHLMRTNLINGKKIDLEDTDHTAVLQFVCDREFPCVEPKLLRTLGLNAKMVVLSVGHHKEGKATTNKDKHFGEFPVLNACNVCKAAVAAYRTLAKAHFAKAVPCKE